MRSVEYCREGQYGGLDNKKAAHFGIGTFHGFFSAGSNEEGIDCFALVEVPGGTIETMWTIRIKFLDNPPKSEENIESPNQQLKDSISLINESISIINGDYCSYDDRNLALRKLGVVTAKLESI